MQVAAVAAAQRTRGGETGFGDAEASSWLLLLTRRMIQKPQKYHRQDGSECHRNMASHYSERSRCAFPDRLERDSVTGMKYSQDAGDVTSLDERDRECFEVTENFRHLAPTQKMANILSILPSG